MQDKNENLKAVFLGYKNADPQGKLDDIRCFDDPNKSWTAERSDADLLDFIKRQIDHSARVCESCSALNIPYIDTGTEFQTSLEEAYKKIAQ